MGNPDSIDGLPTHHRWCTPHTIDGFPTQHRWVADTPSMGHRHSIDGVSPTPSMAPLHTIDGSPTHHRWVTDTASMVYPPHNRWLPYTPSLETSHSIDGSARPPSAFLRITFEGRVLCRVRSRTTNFARTTRSVRFALGGARHDPTVTAPACRFSTSADC